MVNLSAIPAEAYNIEKSWVERGDYVAPNRNVVVSEEGLKTFLYWIHERQSIWYKREVLGLEAPWTNDEVFQTFRFTHPIRDIDKVTIYYRENVLKQIEDTTHSKINILLNTMIFRIFTNPAVWEFIGNLDYKDPTAKAKVDAAYHTTIDFAKSGGIIFTGAYMVNPMRAMMTMYPNYHSSKFPKVDNAFRLIHHLIDNAEYIYQRSVVEAKDMTEQLKVFKTIPGIGSFTAYEWACDLCLAERYEGIKMVDWDDNSATNVGPGAKRGLDQIYINRGNFTYMNAILHLASITEYYFEKYGYAETMKWPDGVSEFVLRTVEHSLCESMKYQKVKKGLGRPRQRFAKGKGEATNGEVGELPV